ncbi:YdaU family protein [Pararhodobacter marinus]|uniref:YdaU family protein n=1 Tax=Pararhodobacter marinus TaxID=2184063 RepID=UPI0011B2756D|nr:YdaU family protein [Pararhodobacter marinus]
MSLAFFPLYPGDFEADTAHLSLAEDGAYNRLMRLCWRTPGCSLPDDEAWIMRKMRARTEEEQDVVRIVLDEFFEREGDRVFSPRLLLEWGKANEAHQRRASAGSRGGTARALKTKEKPSSNAVAKAKQPEPEPEPEPEEVSANAATSGAQQARGSGDFLSEVMAAVGLTDGRCPTHWMPPAASIHVKRWQTDLGLTEAQILEAARESRKRHDDPPNGPKALDSAMKNLARTLKADPLTPGASHSQQSDSTKSRARWQKLAG